MHTLALAVLHALGDKKYTTASKKTEDKDACAEKNNPDCAALIGKARKLVGFFNHSGQNWKKICDYQEVDIAKKPAVFPFNCRALSLNPVKESKE